MTLTEVSYYSRRFAPLAVIAVLVLLIFFYAGRLLLLYLAAQQPKTTFVDATFGKIKQPAIETATPDGKLTYILDTVEGQPITATDSAKVFFLPPTTTKFGFREKIYLMAKTFGFDTNVVKHTLEGSNAVFVDDIRKLTIDITNFNFTYEYDMKKDPTLLLNTKVPNPKEVEEEAIEFLRTVGRYPEELAQGKMITLYHEYDISENTLSPADRPQDANVIEVDFYRPDIEAFPQNLTVVSPRYFNSQNYVIMVVNNDGFRIVKAQVKFFEKSEEQVGIYPVKTGDQAFADLQAGKALILPLPYGSNDVLIKKMFMAYLDPEVYQEYLQPVYVFLGDGDFAAYVPAVTDEYLTR
jgi:hypothetical protein